MYNPDKRKNVIPVILKFPFLNIVIKRRVNNMVTEILLKVITSGKPMSLPFIPIADRQKQIAKSTYFLLIITSHTFRLRLKLQIKYELACFQRCSRILLIATSQLCAFLKLI